LLKYDHDVPQGSNNNDSDKAQKEILTDEITGEEVIKSEMEAGIELFGKGSALTSESVAEDSPEELLNNGVNNDELNKQSNSSEGIVNRGQSELIVVIIWETDSVCDVNPGKEQGWGRNDQQVSVHVSRVLGQILLDQGYPVDFNILVLEEKIGERCQSNVETHKGSEVVVESVKESKDYGNRCEHDQLKIKSLFLGKL